MPVTVRLLARFFGDEKGGKVFDLAKPEDREALLSFPVSLAAEVLRAGNRVNKMDEDVRSRSLTAERPSRRAAAARSPGGGRRR